MERNRQTVSRVVGSAILNAAGGIDSPTVREMGMGALIYSVTGDRLDYGNVSVGMDLGRADAFAKGQVLMAGLLSCMKQSVVHVPLPGRYFKIPFTLVRGHQAWVVRTASTIATFAGNACSDIPLHAAMALASAVDDQWLYDQAEMNREVTLSYLDGVATRAIKLMDLMPDGNVELHWALNPVLSFTRARFARAQPRAPRAAGGS